MADIDPDRWLSLLAAYRNSVDSSPAFIRLQEAQGRWARARSDLETFEARGAVGRRDQRHPDMRASFERDVDELRQRVAEAEREVKRIDALQASANARRNALRQLVDSVKAWAQQQSPPITLPGDGDAVTVTGMTGFAESSTHIATPPGGRDFAPSQNVAPRQGGTATAEPPARHVLMGRIWP